MAAHRQESAGHEESAHPDGVGHASDVLLGSRHHVASDIHQLLRPRDEVRDLPEERLSVPRRWE